MPWASSTFWYLAMVLTEVVKSMDTCGSELPVLAPFFVVITMTPLEAREP